MSLEDNGPGHTVLSPPVVSVLTVAVGVGLNFVLPVPFLPGLLVQLLIGVPVIAVGAFMFFWAGSTMMIAGTHPSPNRPVSTLVTHGPFRYSRNPIYVGLVVMTVGLALAVNNLWIILVVPLEIVFLSLQIRIEEPYLEKRFGDEYRHYRAKVRRWL